MALLCFVFTPVCLSRRSRLERRLPPHPSATSSEDGTPERELCWYGDETFVTHLVKTLNSATISAVVRFGEPRRYEHRRVAADQTHDEVAAMRSSEAVIERGSTLAV